jgi:hypothetical protein
MTDKIEFPGGWAKLRDPHDVTERQRRPLSKVQRALLGSNIGDVLIARQQAGQEVSEEEMTRLLRPYLADEAMDLFEDSDDLLILALVEEWSYEKPVTAEAIQDLPAKVYDTLRDACRPLLPAVLGAEDEQAVLDPESPTTPGSV